MVEFAIKHMMFSTVKGRFGEVSGELFLDAEEPERSSVRAAVNVASIDTNEPQRDAHLRSPDFFDVANFPTISFVSKRVQRTGEARALVIGDLTIRGVTREVAFDTTFLGRGNDPWGKMRVGFSASTTINRSDFGLQWNVALEAGGFLVGDTVKINLEVEAVKKD